MADAGSALMWTSEAAMVLLQSAPPEQLIAEIERLGKLRRQLAAPFVIFEKAGVRCEGACAHPVVLGVIQDVAVTCCNVRPGWERYRDTVRIQKRVGEALAKATGKRPRNNALRGTLTLGGLYQRDFTGSARLRKLRIPGREE